MTIDPDETLLIEPLNSAHDRTAFRSGADNLDRYFSTQAGQDVRRFANGVFVLIDRRQPTRALGYYTLCAIALEPGDVPVAVRKKLPRYPLVSATLLGRLAVSADRLGQGLGALLLVDAMDRAEAVAAAVGSCMLIVDALDERAARFYQAHGFARLTDSDRLALPMTDVKRYTRRS